MVNYVITENRENIERGWDREKEKGERGVCEREIGRKEGMRREREREKERKRERLLDGIGKKEHIRERDGERERERIVRK